MTTSIFAIMIRAAMGTAALMLAFLLFHRYRSYGGSHLRDWAYGWGCLAIYHAVNAMGPLWVAAGNQTLSPERLLPSVVANVAIYVAGVLLVSGGADLLWPQSTVRRRLKPLLMLVAGAAVAMTVLSALTTPTARYFLRVGLSTAFLGTSLFVTAWLIRTAAKKRELRTAFLTSTALAFGVLYLHYFLGVTAYALGWMDIGYFQYLGPLDLLLGFAVGVGMLVWQLEEERKTALEATEALRVSEERLRQSQKLEAIGRLAGGIAHDFNNLLTVILGYSDLLSSPESPPQDVQSAAAKILQASERATSLTERLLAFSRRQVVRPVLLDINDAVREVVSVAGRLVGERIQIRTHLTQDPLYVDFDPGQLNQIFLNLIINAKDAMPGGGELNFQTQRVDEDDRSWNEIVIEDSGHGMDEETLGSAYEPFFTTKGELGTGLGLSTVREVIEQAGGKIQMQSFPGRGTRVSVRIPSSPAASRPAAAELSEPSTRGQRFAGKRVLLVEDDEGVSVLIRDLLIDAGFSVDVAPSGEEALDSSSAELVDLLLTDVVLPGITGIALVERAREKRPELPAVLMTGYAATAAELLSRESHIVVRKPFTKRELLDGVAKAIA